jgi:hypothetical protein
MSNRVVNNLNRDVVHSASRKCTMHVIYPIGLYDIYSVRHIRVSIENETTENARDPLLWIIRRNPWNKIYNRVKSNNPISSYCRRKWRFSSSDFTPRSSILTVLRGEGES